MFKTPSLNNKQLGPRQRNKTVNPLQQKLFAQIHTLDIEQANSKANKATITKQQTSKLNKFRIIDGFPKPMLAGLNKRAFTRESQRKPQQKTEDDDFKLISNIEDPLAKLIMKARQITTQNKQVINRTKKQLKKQSQATFLTGTGMYEQEIQPQTLQTCKIDEDSMLKYLVKTQQEDDLAQLRRMIRLTDKNLNNYQNQMYLSSKSVVEAADHFNKQLDTGLLYRLGKIRSHNGESGFNSLNNGRKKTKMYSNFKIMNKKYS